MVASKAHIQGLVMPTAATAHQPSPVCHHHHTTMQRTMATHYCPQLLEATTSYTVRWGTRYKERPYERYRGRQYGVVGEAAHTVAYYLPCLHQHHHTPRTRQSYHIGQYVQRVKIIMSFAYLHWARTNKYLGGGDRLVSCMWCSNEWSSLNGHDAPLAIYQTGRRQPSTGIRQPTALIQPWRQWHSGHIYMEAWQWLTSSPWPAEQWIVFQLLRGSES